MYFYVTVDQHGRMRLWQVEGVRRVLLNDEFKRLVTNTYVSTLMHLAIKRISDIDNSRLYNVN